MKRLSAESCVAFAALYLACCGSAQAATLVDTGAIRNGFISEVVIDRIYGQITLGAASRIDAIQGYISSNGGALRLSLLSDLNGRPGSLLQSPDNVAYTTVFETRGTAMPFRSVHDWQGATDLGWLVAAGTYWVSFANENMRPYVVGPSMQRNAAVRPLAKYARYYSSDMSTWIDDGNYAFRVLGTVAAVPEPATWAMMIVGFGATGAMLRRRRDRVELVTA